MLSKCEAADDLSVDCKQCGKRAHVFWAETPIDKFIDFLRHSTILADKICHITCLSWFRRTVSVAKVFGIEMEAPIVNGRYQNS